MLKLITSVRSKSRLITPLLLSVLVLLTANFHTSAQTQTPYQVVDFIATDNSFEASRLIWTNPNDDTISEIVVIRKEGSFPESHLDGTEVAKISSSPQPGEIIRREDNNLDQLTYYYAVFTKNDSGWNDTVTEGENADRGYGKKIWLGVGFTTTLDSVDPPNDSFTCSFNATPTPISTDEEPTGYTWIFNEGTKKEGNDLSHAFSSGLGKAYPVELIIKSDNFQGYEKQMINGLGGIPRTLVEAFNAGASTPLDNLKASLDWNDGSLEKIYRASVEVALKIYDLSQEYGLVSATTLASAAKKTYQGPLPISASKVLPPSLDNLFSTFTPELKQFESLKEPLSKIFPTFNDWRGETSIIAAATTSMSFTLPELYTELEELLTFTDDIISKLSPVLEDNSFELQLPTSSYSTTPDYVALDNGDIAALLAYVKGWEAGIRGMISYTPGSLVTKNIEIVIGQNGSSIQGQDTVMNQIKSNFDNSRENGVLDLNGDGDGDSANGFEVLPDDFLTIRDKSILTNAHGDLLKIIDWLKVAINDMPSSPGTHDPQIDWPIMINSPLFGNSLSKSEAIDLLNKIRSMLEGTESLDIDIDNDGNVDYTTKVNLSAPFNDPTEDLKTLLPDLVKASNPNGPLVVIHDTTNGVNSNWKIDGVYNNGNDDTLNTDDDVLLIDFPDPTFNGVLPKGDLNNLLNLTISGRSNVLLPPVVESSTHPNQETVYDNNDPKFSWDEPVSLSGISGYSYKLNQKANTIPDTKVDTSKRTKSYSGLDNGTYYFHIRAKTNDGKWTLTTHYKIQIDLHKPTADFSYSPNEPTVKDTVEFTDQSSDEEGDIKKWRWNFGDGDTSSKENPTHQYTDSGEFTVKLTVTDEDGLTGSTTRKISVENLSPTANFSISPKPPFVDEKVKFVNESKDPENSIKECKWNFGDGDTSSKDNPTHQYSEASTFTVKLTVEDIRGLTDTKEKQIEVTNPVKDVRTRFSDSPDDVDNPDQVIGKKEAQYAALSYLADKKLSGIDRSLTKSITKELLSYHLLGKEIKSSEDQDTNSEAQKVASSIASSFLQSSLPKKVDNILAKLDADGPIIKPTIKVFNLEGKIQYQNSFDRMNQVNWEHLLDDIKFKLQEGMYLYIIEAKEVDGEIKRTELEKMSIK